MSFLLDSVDGKNLIKGNWISSGNKSPISIINPATAEKIGPIPNHGSSETLAAIDAAHEALVPWSTTDTLYRTALLHKLHDCLMDNQEELAFNLTMEQGKPLPESRGEIAIGAAYIKWFAEEIRRLKGEIIPAPTGTTKLLTTYHAVGVIGAITPWNFPSSMLARKLGPALAAGCTIVAKPSSLTPYSGLVWGKLCEEVGFPAGVVNIVTGSAKDIGDTIMSDHRVRKVTFTGSTEVGKTLIRQSADTVKKISMELGGNAPFIVFDDANLDKATEGALISKYRNMGQTCVCTNRFYVQEGIHDAFVERLKEISERLVIGDGTKAGVDQGPLINESAVLKVEEIIKDALKKGGNLICGGQRHKLGGTFFQPTVITGANDQMLCATEEIFGPVSMVFKFSNEAEVIEAANNTQFGLASYIYTNDLNRSFRMHEALEYGMIGINSGLITTVEAPFGGVKESGIGKEGGSQGLTDYLSLKYTSIGM